MRLYDNEAYRDTFMQGVYDLLEDDPINERANAIIELFDNAPTIPNSRNEPLTLKELREMEGQPVYVVPANEYSELGKWCVISIGDSDDYSCALVPGVEYWSWKFEAYGEQWLAYRRPPEGEEAHP